MPHRIATRAAQPAARANARPLAWTAAALAVSLGLLTACGGDDDGSSGGTATASAASGGPRFDAPFAASAPMRQILFGEDLTSITGSATTKPTQETGGGVRALGSYTASTDTKVENIAGNAAYAKGTWVGGKLTNGTQSTDNKNPTHYAVANTPLTLPASATPTCSPVLDPARAGSATATVTGSATLSITASTAQAGIKLSVAAPGGAIAVDASRSIAANETRTQLSALFSSGSSAELFLGGDAKNGFVLLAPFKAVSGTTTYRGIAAFTCK